MGPRPGPDYDLDRINSNKNYNKENCRWLPRSENRSRQHRSEQCDEQHEMIYGEKEGAA